MRKNFQHGLFWHVFVRYFLGETFIPRGFNFGRCYGVRVPKYGYRYVCENQEYYVENLLHLRCRMEFSFHPVIFANLESSEILKSR